MKKIIFFLSALCCTGNLSAAEPWDIIDKAMDPWNADGGAATNKAWSFTKGTNTPATGIVTQETGY
ncbi:MAG: hypothetical protein LBR34_00425, partial [Prevotella sp.]|nr:hypothetical protein [Prevotella sp.]